MTRYSEAELIAFEHARAHADGCSVRRCECRYLQSVIEILTAYIRATVGVEPMPPMPPGQPPEDPLMIGWLTYRTPAEYRGWEQRYADYWARRAGGGA